MQILIANRWGYGKQTNGMRYKFSGLARLMHLVQDRATVKIRKKPKRLPSGSY